jgi:NADH-quinone oxidoreductase subunit J
MAEAVFYVFASVSLLSAVMVVASRSVVHSALYLVLSFLAVAGLFILQGAEFLGAVQILLYAGSIVVMFVFVVMMVNLKEETGPRWASLRSIGGLVLGSAVLLQLLSIVLRSGGWLARPGIGANAGVTDGMNHIEALGNTLFREQILPFEILSLVLLAALFGLLVIGRRK